MAVCGKSSDRRIGWEISRNSEPSEEFRLLPALPVPQANTAIRRSLRISVHDDEDSDLALLQIAPSFFVLGFRFEANLW